MWKKKATIGNLNPSFKTIEDFNEALTKLTNCYEDQEALVEKTVN